MEPSTFGVLNEPDHELDCVRIREPARLRECPPGPEFEGVAHGRLNENGRIKEFWVKCAYDPDTCSTSIRTSDPASSRIVRLILWITRLAHPGS
jgi:hypothetical protein